MRKVGIIGGTGVDETIFSEKFKLAKVSTKYGKVIVREGVVAGKTVFYLNRHGRHYCAPHQINYRANVMALKQKGVDCILATASVGSMNKALKPGDIILLADFIDFTQGRPQFFNVNLFTDISYPYDQKLTKLILKTAAWQKIKIQSGAVYVCTQGPRFESKAEIKMYRKLGADVVGMTQVPEVVLAAEAELPYAVIGLVTNPAAGVTGEKVTCAEVVRIMKENDKKLKTLFQTLIRTL